MYSIRLSRVIPCQGLLSRCREVFGMKGYQRFHSQYIWEVDTLTTSCPNLERSGFCGEPVQYRLAIHRCK